MNILHMKYAVEVERTKSITKAADNLYMNQPNLSRAIKELEESLGITLFKRTPQGIVTTAQGEEFLTYARHILEEIEELEDIYRYKTKNTAIFRISAPRAGYIAKAFTSFVGKLDLNGEIEIDYYETNSVKAIDNIVQNNYSLGIIRFQSMFEKNFLHLLSEKELKYELLWTFPYVVVMSEAHRLAGRESVAYDDLADGIEIAYGDPYVPSLPLLKARKYELPEQINKRIFVYERGSQFELLSGVPSAYMFVSPLPAEYLARYGLVQLPCTDMKREYRDLLVYKKGYKLNSIEKSFIDELYKVRDAFSV